MSDVSKLGLGAMLAALGGSKESAESFQRAIGRTIATVQLDAEYNGGDGGVRIAFSDGSEIALYDDARSCCESRYLHTDDDLSGWVGAKLVSAEQREAPTPPHGPDDYGDEHEVAFLVIETDRGSFVVESHNRHNGYYGGIAIRCSELRTASERAEERGDD